MCQNTLNCKLMCSTAIVKNMPMSVCNTTNIAHRLSFQEKNNKSESERAKEFEQEQSAAENEVVFNSKRTSINGLMINFSNDMLF